MICCVLNAQSRPTLCDLIDRSPPGSSAPGDSPSKNTGVGCHFLLQGIFPTRGSHSSLLNWQVDSLPLSHQGRPYYYLMCVNTTEWKMASVSKGHKFTSIEIIIISSVLKNTTCFERSGVLIQENLVNITNNLKMSCKQNSPNIESVIFKSLWYKDTEF